MEAAVVPLVEHLHLGIRNNLLARVAMALFNQQTTTRCHNFLSWLSKVLMNLGWLELRFFFAGPARPLAWWRSGSNAERT